MAQQAPKLLFVGAGNIAQSIMKGFINRHPSSANLILATAPSRKNLDQVQRLGCRTVLLSDLDCYLEGNFDPDFTFLCLKPHVLLNTTPQDTLYHVIDNLSSRHTLLSLLAGVGRAKFYSMFKVPKENIVRVMLNTAAEINQTSVFYNVDQETNNQKIQSIQNLLGNLGAPVVRLQDESLMDVATGVCGSGIAFFYEMIQSISNAAVMNGLTRLDAESVAAQLSIAAGSMVLQKQKHPYQLRDQVSSPAGTTIYGLHKWHDQSTGQKIGQAVQSSIDRAKSLLRGD